MTQPIEIPPLANHPICLYVGNNPVSGYVVELSGLALRLALEGEVAEVPRVRVELEHADPQLSSLQLQGMITQRESGQVTVTLERLLIAAGQEVVDGLLGAWFPAVPLVEDCYQEMMRGYGYELRKAIIAGRAPVPSTTPLARAETIAGIPVAAVKAAMNAPPVRPEAPVSTPPPEQVAAPPPASPPPPPVVEVVPAQPIAPPRPSRGQLPSQMLRTAERLLNGTEAALLWVDCCVDSPGATAGYGRGVVYRLADEGRLVFVGARGVQPGFGGKVELIVDLEQGGATHTVRVAASVAWIAPDPDVPGVSLMAVRLTPTNQLQDLEAWFIACRVATQQIAQGGGVSALPSRDLLDGLLQSA